MMIMIMMMMTMIMLLIFVAALLIKTKTIFMLGTIRHSVCSSVRSSVRNGFGNGKLQKFKVDRNIPETRVTHIQIQPVQRYQPRI